MIAPLFIDRGRDGKPCAVFQGDVMVLQVEHAPACPGGHGHPERCNCTPKTWTEPMTEEIAADIDRQRRMKRQSKYP